jgi:hypothetical protein
MGKQRHYEKVRLFHEMQDMLPESFQDALECLRFFLVQALHGLRGYIVPQGHGLLNLVQPFFGYAYLSQPAVMLGPGAFGESHLLQTVNGLGSGMFRPRYPPAQFRWRERTPPGYQNMQDTHLCPVQTEFPELGVQVFINNLKRINEREKIIKSQIISLNPEAFGQRVQSFSVGFHIISLMVYNITLTIKKKVVLERHFNKY